MKEIVIRPLECGEEFLEDEIKFLNVDINVYIKTRRNGEYNDHMLDENGDLIETKEGWLTAPLYAYIHSGVKFELSPRCRWDSGRVGIIEYKEGADLDAYLSKLSSLWNGHVYSISLVENTQCTCCGEFSTEVIDSYFAIDDDIDDSIENMKRDYELDEDINVKEEY